MDTQPEIITLELDAHCPSGHSQVDGKVVAQIGTADARAIFKAEEFAAECGQECSVSEIRFDFAADWPTHDPDHPDTDSNTICSFECSEMVVHVVSGQASHLQFTALDKNSEERAVTSTVALDAIREKLQQASA